MTKEDAITKAAAWRRLNNQGVDALYLSRELLPKAQALWDEVAFAGFNPLELAPSTHSNPMNQLPSTDPLAMGPTITIFGDAVSINVGGRVIVASLEKWHAALNASPTPPYSPQTHPDAPGVGRMGSVPRDALERLVEGWRNEAAKESYYDSCIFGWCAAELSDLIKESK